MRDFRNVGNHNGFTRLARQRQTAIIKQQMLDHNIDPNNPKAMSELGRKRKELGLMPVSNTSLHNAEVKQAMYSQLVPLMSKISQMFYDIYKDIDLAAALNSDVYRYLQKSQKAIDGYLDQMYVDKKTEDIYVSHCTNIDKLDKLIERFHPDKTEDLINALEYLLDNEDMSIQDVAKQKVKMKNVTLGQYAIDENIKTKLKQFEVEGINVLTIPLHQLALLIPKDKLQNTKGFGEKSIEVLAKVFEVSGIKW